MSARYLLVDVFARAPLAGNGLVVFPDPGSVDPASMQKIAREMNLSETTFVTNAGAGGYDVRIFTPRTSCPSPAIRPSERRGCCARSAS